MVKKSEAEINKGEHVTEGLQDLAIDESSEDTLTEPEVSQGELSRNHGLRVCYAQIDREKLLSEGKKSEKTKMAPS